jgi:hypothetical protein
VVGRHDAAQAAAALQQLRTFCLALPRTSERLSHGGPAFFADPRCFAMFTDDHHDDGRLAVWCAAPEGVQAEMVQLEPDRFFRPPYVGHRGWLGVLLDVVDPDELREIVTDAYRCTASARGRRELQARESQ